MCFQITLFLMLEQNKVVKTKRINMIDLFYFVLNAQ